MTWAERRLLVEAALALTGARLALASLPFRRIAAYLGTVGAESAFVISPSQNEMTWQVGWAVQSMARRLPWAIRCLVQSLA
ncbi:MAG: lasso peptide biosynthesis B2 protein, partial [Planctomycetota bacterium]